MGVEVGPINMLGVEVEGVDVGGRRRGERLRAGHGCGGRRRGWASAWLA